MYIVLPVSSQHQRMLGRSFTAGHTLIVPEILFFAEGKKREKYHFTLPEREMFRTIELVYL